MLRNWSKRVFNWQNFYDFLQQEMKVFLYFLALFSLFRAVFIVLMHDYLGSAADFSDVMVALFYGFKLSLKSAGVLLLGSAGLGLFAYLFLPQYSRWLRSGLGFIYIFVLTLLFCARIPYYAQFHSGFNQLIFNTLHDDMYALFISLIAQFHLPLRLLGVFLLSGIFYLSFVRWLKVRQIPLPDFGRWYANAGLRSCYLAALYQAAIFVSFGGSMSYAGNVDWENAGVTKDQLLNEAILDDLQALYRAYEMNGRLMRSTGLDFAPQQIGAYAARLTGKPMGGDDLDAYLEKSAAGAPLGKPQHIFLILSESYANWPLLDKYQQLNIASGVKEMIARPDSIYVSSFLPNGMSTISGVMGLVTGFADANLYLTTMPEAYEAPYSTAIAPQLQRLGYQAKFWYAGPTSWENVKAFSVAQGFTEFYGSGDYEGAQGNVWGCDDAFLYRAVLAGIKADTPSFNLILNVSNHSPFSVDLAKAGFDRAALVSALPEGARQDAELIKQLGHFWYADKMLAAFVKEARQKYPDSLFVIVGDHADRVNVDKTPSLYERYAVPLVISGKGITKEVFPDRAAGSHIDLIPTILELTAPRGFTYYSVGTSLTRGNLMGTNYGFWITSGSIGKTDAAFVPEMIRQHQEAPDPSAVEGYVEAIRSISWWRSKYGSGLVK